jgi:hypothetical protein
MKNLSTLVLLIILLFCISLAGIAQVTATASTSATIIAPIAISKAVDMNFGNIASGAVGGTVVLSPDGSLSPTGDVTLPLISGTVSAAKFTVTGLSGSTISITLPVGSITLNNLGNTMKVKSFTSNPSLTGTLTGGIQDIFVGATLVVGASQVAGLYFNLSNLFVTVNYN